MTSKEIEKKQPFEISDTAWLKEIALQLALLREAFTTPVTPIEPRKPLKNGPDRIRTH